MPTVEILGLPEYLIASSVLQELAVSLLPHDLADITELGIEPDQVTVIAPLDMVRREAPRIVVFVHDLYDLEERTPAVRQHTAQIILRRLIRFAGNIRNCHSIQVYLGAHRGDAQGRASYAFDR